MATFHLLSHAPGEGPYRADLPKRLTQELFARSRGTLLALAVALGMIRAILGAEADATPGLRDAFLGVIVSALVRAGLVLWVHRHPSRWTYPRILHGAFVGVTALMGLALGALVLVVYLHLGPAQVAMLAVCLAGIHASALVSMAPSLTAYLLYTVPSLGAFTFMAAFLPPPGFGELFSALMGVLLLALLALAAKAHLALRENILLTLQLGEMALRDNLTRLRNRGFLMEFMGSETEQVLRSWAPDTPPGRGRQSVAILILDLDRFKHVNDTYGHRAGDAVLQQLSALLEEVVRKPDLSIRWGGEEFVIIARDTEREAPARLAERIRQRVQDHLFRLPSGEVLHKTCSIGYSLYPFLPDQPGRLNWEQVLAIADAGLYRAKQQGRNCIVGVVNGRAPWHHPEAILDLLGRDPLRAVRDGYVQLLSSVSEPEVYAGV